MKIAIVALCFLSLVIATPFARVKRQSNVSHSLRAHRNTMQVFGIGSLSGVNIPGQGFFGLNQGGGGNLDVSCKYILYQI